MPRHLELLVLTKDLPNKDKRPRRGAFRDMPDEFEEGDLFVREVIVPLNGKRKLSDSVIALDDDDCPTFGFDAGTPMHEAVLKISRRAKPCLARLLHEYDAYMPHTVAEVLHRLIESDVVSLRQLEDVLIKYRQENDYDMQDEDDTIALPKTGRSKLDDENAGGTDPRREDFDPDTGGYVDPEAAGAEGAAEAESKTGIKTEKPKKANRRSAQ